MVAARHMGIRREGMEYEYGVGPVLAEGAVGLVCERNWTQLPATLQFQLIWRFGECEVLGLDYSD
jgi:hypothetical protein